jgi:hypothetical protein
LGAAVNFDPQTSAVFQRPGALAGSSDTAISTTLADGQKMRVPFNAALNPANAFTAEAWLKPGLVMDPAVSSGLNCALSSGNFADPRSGWLLYQAVDGWNFRAYTGAGTGTALSITAPVEIVADEWYHVVMTWDGTFGKVFVNGVLGATSLVGECLPPPFLSRLPAAALATRLPVASVAASPSITSCTEGGAGSPT